MTRGVSIAKAVQIARRATDARKGTGRVDEEGKLQAAVFLNVSEARLKPGKSQDVLAVLYEAGTLEGEADPMPIATDDGTHAIAIPLTIQPRKGQEVACVRVGVRLPGHEGTDVDILVEPVRRNRLPLVAAATVALATAAALALNPWGDPSARKGHYEGKTKDEIQADLDADVAWHSMEISVASRVTMREGSTSCELRVENVEANHCDQKVSVWETGHEDDVLFESGAIAPGEYLQHVEFAHPLEVGHHTLTVQFQGYEQPPTLLSDEGVPLGHDTFGASCAAEVELEVVPASE